MLASKNYALRAKRLVTFAIMVSAGIILAGGSPVLAGDSVRYFSFVALTQADSDDGKVHRFGGGGDAVFDPDTGWVNGGGTFEHVDFAPAGTPKPSLGSAKWRITKLLKFTPCTPPKTCTAAAGTTYGHIRPGVVEMEVDLDFDGGKKIEGAMLTVICNVGFGGIVNKDPVTGNSLPEGYFLTFTDPVYGRLEFKPLDPIIGITHIGVMPPHELR